MTASAYCSALARLIVDCDFRRRVRSEGAAALRGRPLTVAERDRLLTAAASGPDPIGEPAEGLDQHGPALRQLLARLPLTFTLLDLATSQRELALFWAGRPPAGFYHLEEAIAFCEHLLARRDALAIPYLDEIVAYERARLELQRERPGGGDPPLAWVEFEHDPLPLIAEVAAGRVPESAGRRRLFLIGRRVGDEAEWRLAEPIERMFALR